MSKARPKEYVAFMNANKATEMYIDISPQQRWDVEEDIQDNTKVKLSRKNVTMFIPKIQFEKYFVVVE